MSILNWNWDQNLAVPTCSIPTPSGLKGQERPLSLVQSRYFLFSNSTEFHLIPSSSHSTEKHSQLLLAYIGCQTADCLDYTGLYCIPAGTSHTKCFLGDQGSLLGCTSTPGAVLKLEIPRQQAVFHMLLSKHSLLSLSKYKPAPNQLPKHLVVNLYSLWLTLLQQRDPVFWFLSRYWKWKAFGSLGDLSVSFLLLTAVTYGHPVFWRHLKDLYLSPVFWRCLNYSPQYIVSRTFTMPGRSSFQPKASLPILMATPYLLQDRQSVPASGDATKPAFQGISLLEFQPAVMCYL